MSWPASFVVAKAYLDQLVRSKSIDAGRARTLRSQLDRAESLAPGAGRSNAVLNQLESLSRDLDQDAAAATSAIDKSRLSKLAATIRVRVAELR
jgi:hypothetical protein